MNEPSDGPANCAACAYWEQLRQAGNCRLHAPNPSVNADEVAHWPQTHGDQWCAQGVAVPAPTPRVRCADCFAWRRPGNGLNPADRGDMPMAWWAAAGYCARRAPRPSPEPGMRAFWRATHGEDSCAEGRARR